MKYGCGDQNDKFASCTSFMFGVESMPYCCAAKSIRKEAGATQQAVECEIPILKVGVLRVTVRRKKGKWYVV